MVFKVLVPGLLIWINSLILFGGSISVNDSTIALDEVVVRNTRLADFAVGTTVHKIDSFILQHCRNQSVADLLSAHTAFSVSTYGPGGLSNISLRGGGSRHVAILWNGFDLKNPMNASMNFSSIPVSFFDGITIQYGGAGTLYGSGATTGIIHLDNTLLLGKGPSISGGFMAGSFGSFNQTVKLSYSNKTFATSTRFFYQTGKNDFKYKEANRSAKRLQNAEYSGYAVIQQNALKMGNHSIIRSDIWYQNYSKDIPSLTTDAEPGNTSELDENLRIAVNYAHTADKLIFNSRSGIFNDRITYYNPELVPGKALSNSVNIINEIEAKCTFSPNHKINGGINYTFETADADGYSESHQRNRYSFFWSYRFSTLYGKLTSVLSGRQEIVDTKSIPFIYSAGIDYECVKNLHLKANASKNYMLPTFNNLYWAKSTYTQGNPDLKAESGYSAETGILHEFVKGNLASQFEISLFYNLIDNWIIWLPDSSLVWKPDNYNDGHSTGVEILGKINLKGKNLTQNISYLYGYTNAFISEYDPISKTNVEKELIYVPKHKASIAYDVEYRKYSATLSLTYNSLRKPDYVSKPLDPYLLAGLTLAREFYFSDFKMNIYLKINNITNTTYQVMAGYAMPLCNFLAGLNINFN